jgi:hypothetical protein
MRSVGWIDALAGRFGFPRMNTYSLYVAATRARFARPHREHRPREVAITEVLVEGFLAARAAAGDGARPREDPFSWAKRRGKFDTPLQTALEKNGTQLGEHVRGLAWAREASARHLAALGDVPERAATILALDDACATGALVWCIAHEDRPPPELDALCVAARKSGALAPIKKPSLAAAKKALPPVPFVAFHPAGHAPASVGASACNPTGEGECRWLRDPPRDAEGRPMRFVAQIDLKEAGLDELVPDLRLVALFQPERGRGGVAVARARQEPHTEGEPDPRLVAVAFERKKVEPQSGAWAMLASPGVLDAAKREAWDEATREKIHATSKVGGTYAPVQGSLRLPEGTQRAQLVFALDFDHGARLPDAGLAYVLRIERSAGVELVVHTEHT